MQHFKAAIFDLDGTLLNTYAGVRDGVLFLINKYNLPKLSEEQLRKFVGPPIKDSMKFYYNLSDEEADNMQLVFREYYSKQAVLKAEHYDGMLETLQMLQKYGVYTSVATYKRKDMAERVLSYHGLSCALNSIEGSNNAGTLSKSDIIELAIKDSGVKDYSEVIMIGDTDNDAIGAKNLGVPFIGVTYGFGFKTKYDVDKYPNVGVATKPKDLINYILKEV